VLDSVHPDDRARVVAETEASYASGDVRGAQDYRAVTRAGATIWLHVRYTILRDEAGEAFAWQAFSLDVTAQRSAELERDRMRDELLGELSTPLIPIADDVLAMPLIGRIDGPRAQRVLEVLLAGLGRTRARWAILDITGVPGCDAEVARALVRSARAAKLLGVEVLNTGLRPEVARTFVALGEDLAGVTTLATLQSGVAHALRRGARA
jgi:rsbT co-antagonist protein RsbR